LIGLSLICFGGKTALLELIALDSSMINIWIEQASHMKEIFEGLRPAIFVGRLHRSNSIVSALLLTRLLSGLITWLCTLMILLSPLRTLLIVVAITLVTMELISHALLRINQVLDVTAKIINVLWLDPIEVLVLLMFQDSI
jgi:hypothetical protein